MRRSATSKLRYYAVAAAGVASSPPVLLSSPLDLMNCGLAGSSEPPLGTWIPTPTPPTPLSVCLFVYLYRGWISQPPNPHCEFEFKFEHHSLGSCLPPLVGLGIPLSFLLGNLAIPVDVVTPFSKLLGSLMINSRKICHSCQYEINMNRISSFPHRISSIKTTRRASDLLQ